MSQAKMLYSLQELDLQIIRNNKRLDEIALASADNQVVQKAQRQVEAAEKTLQPLRIQNKNLELEIQSTQAKSKATEDRLYSGTVKNPKELQEMQQEITSLKKRNEELEEQLLEVMMNIEEAENALHDKQENLQTVTQDWENEHSDLLSEKSNLEKEIAELQGKRETQISHIPPSNVNLYNDMRKKKSNKPIAIMQGRSCAVCGIEQTLAIEKDVLRNQSLIYCVNCGRILVASHEI